MLNRNFSFGMLPLVAVVAPAQSIPDNFIGDWSSTECWKNLSGGSDCIEYKLHIRKNGSELIATLDGDGFQTLVRLNAKVKRVHDGIEIICAEDRGSGLPKFKPGVSLFKLLAYRNIINTVWLAIEPISKAGNVKFVRIPGSP